MSLAFAFDHPRLLLALWALVPIGLLLVLRSRRRQRDERRFAEPVQHPRVLPGRSRGRGVLRRALWCAALAAFVLALAGPRHGVTFQEVHRRGADLFVLLDVSRSMLSEDLRPNRLERARDDVRDLLRHLGEDRVGLIAFAGKAVVACPLTHDQGFFLQALAEVSPDSVPLGGTAIGDAVRLALDTMTPEAERDQALLLITDGEDHDSFAVDAARRAAERKVAIFTVGLGDAQEGSRIPVESEDGSRHWLQHDGQEVWSKMDESLLEDLARTTNGAYVPARTSDYDLGKIYEEHLVNLTREDFESTRRERYRHRYQWFAGLGLALLVLEALVAPVSRRPLLAAGLVVLLGAPGFAAPAQEGPTATGADAEPARALTASQQVALGLEHLSNAEIEPAIAAFSAARALSDAPVVPFDSGVALQRAGRFEDARTEYLLAASSRDPELSLRARYSLGRLAAQEAESIFGEHPEDADRKTREQGLEAVERAITQYRRVLETDPNHADARHDLELLRLWVKHMRDLWKKKDEQQQDQQDQQQDLVSLLVELLEEQDAIRAATAETAALPDSPLARQELRPLGQRQDDLHSRFQEFGDRARKEVLDPVRQSVAAKQGNTGAAPAQDDPEATAANLLEGLLDRGASALEAASVALLDRATAADPTGTNAATTAASTPGESSSWDAIAKAQDDATAAMFSWFGALAAFPQCVKEAYGWQEKLTQDLRALDATTASTDPKLAPAPVEPSPTVRLSIAKEQRVGALATILVQKGQQTVAQMQQALESSRAAADPNAAGGTPGGAAPAGGPGSGPGAPAGPDPEKLEEQIEKLKAALAKAEANAPGIEDNARLTLTHFAADERSESLGTAQEALRLLKEILDELPKDENQGGGKGKDDSPKDDSEKQDPEKKDDGSKDPQDQEQQQDSKDPSENSQSQDSSAQDGGQESATPLTPEQLDAMIRKAEEAERDAKEQRRALELLQGGKKKVDRDW